MEVVLIHPCYFGPISQFVAIANAEALIFENEDNYQKQTYRNRMYIYGANGKLSLNIPIKHTGDKTQHQKFREVRIENEFNWQKQHWKSLQTAYRTSPFFEFYEDDFQPLYQKKHEFLMDFNYECLDLLQDCLQLDLEAEKTGEYIMEPPSHIIDSRGLVNAKKENVISLEPYNQVFGSKFGFINDLCILDLLFNEGPSSGSYLLRQDLNIQKNSNKS